MSEERQALETLLALKQAVKDRNADDPLISYKPFPKQQEFVDAVLKEEIPRVYAFCGNRSGKTDIGSYCGAKLARFGRDRPASSFSGAGKTSIEVRDRATAGWVIALDSKFSRTTVEPKYFNNGNVSPGQRPPFIPDREIAHWNALDRILKLKNGSIIEFRSIEAGADKLQGAGKDWIHFDEEPPKPHFDEACMRVEAGRRLQTFVTATLLPPVGMKGGVTWMFPEVIEPYREGTLEDAKVFNWATYDNPYIEEAEIRSLEALFPPETTIGKIRLLGELIPGLGGARAYHNFTRKFHIKKDMQINPNLPLCWAWDFNVDPLVCVLAQVDEGKFRFFREFSTEDGSIAGMIDKVYPYIKDHPNEIHIYGDATGRNRKVSKDDTASTWTIMFNELRSYDLEVKKKVPESNPPITNRVDAVNMALKGPEGQMDVEVDPQCRELIKDLEGVLLDSDGTIKKSRNPSDPYYARTHISDAVGYFICYERPIKRRRFRRYRTKVKQISYS